MKPAFKCLAAVCVVATLQGQVIESVSREEMRRAMLDGFRFVEKEKPVEYKDSPIIKSSQPVVESDTLVMEKIVVTDHNLYWNLASDIKRAGPLKAQSHSKFGTGIHVKDFGKLRASCVTILYIPVMVGASW